MLWRPERIWDGLAVVIVGGGESFTAAHARRIGMARAKDAVRVIAVNDAIYPCWFADIAYASDARWWRGHGPLPGFGGIRVSLEAADDVGDILCLKNTGTEGFDPVPGNMRSGGNGGYQAAHLAAQLGARLIVLVALDMRGGHWFGSHPASVAPMQAPNWLNRIADFRVLAAELERIGVEVANISPVSAIDAFRRGDLEEELRRAEEAHAQAIVAAAVTEESGRAGFDSRQGQA